MERKPLFTIAIPAYKSKYLGEAIESVLRQTISDFELLIVNDASPHNISEVVGCYTDKRIRYVINEKNIGKDDPVKNWNKCLKLAQGEYFSLLCDDDIYAPTFLEELYALTLRYPSCNVFRAGIKQIDGKGRMIGIYPTCPDWESSVEYIIHLSGGRRFQTISEFMYRKKHIEDLGGYHSLPKAWAADRLSVIIFGMNGGIASTSHRLVSFRTSGENLSGEVGKYTIEKVRANVEYTRIINKLVANDDEDIKRLIAKYRQKTEDEEMFSYLTMANTKDICFLWRKRKTDEYNISTKCFYKAIIKKIINVIIK